MASQVNKGLYQCCRICTTCTVTCRFCIIGLCTSRLACGVLALLVTASSDVVVGAEDYDEQQVED